MQEIAEEIDWLSLSQSWAYAYGGPLGSATIKQQPQDFKVVELMDVVPTGEGEHHWLRIRKTRQNTDLVAKQLARFCNVAYRDVGYSGLKDNFAITEQWFSIWLPGRRNKAENGNKEHGPNWSNFEFSGVEVLEATRHQRKLKRGTHRANRFEIEIRDLDVAIDISTINDLLTQICEQGVPNYYGPQRFGHNLNNMPRALAMLSGAVPAKGKIKDRNQRSILLSAARSWLFNCQLHQRILNNTWQSLYHGEPANLDGSASVFPADGADEEEQRLQSLDIHPTAALWGDHKLQDMDNYTNLHELERAWVMPFRGLVDGLVSARVAYSRRPLRMPVRELEWSHSEGRLHISFTLSKGQFATSVIRELVNTQ